MTGRPRVSLSGGWLVLWDEFHRDRYAGPLRTALERWTGAEWAPDEARPLITLGRVLTYPGLGRRRQPWPAESSLYRVRVDAPGYRALYPPDEPPDLQEQTPEEYADEFDAAVDAREFVVPHYDDLHPPAVEERQRPERLRLAPAVAFGYPPGTRVIRGLVRRPGGAGIAGALVQARTPDRNRFGDWYERTVTDPGGRFRLALRGRGQVTGSDVLRPPFEVFTVGAYQAPRRTGSVEVRLDRSAGQPGGTEPDPYVIEIGD
jgi:hypothetical protein